MNSQAYFGMVGRAEKLKGVVAPNTQPCLSVRFSRARTEHRGTRTHTRYRSIPPTLPRFVGLTSQHKHDLTTAFYVKKSSKSIMGTIPS